ncbi:MAG: YegS/Rv2252/BmrU family lipid kinase [Oscillospiraceae bacterium]|jgi:YegS/Rv2252/BmrU family lipid kinase|nr:YegS/Rv2252/BmrU family lipid kinase [Oscillospiraceae bacterium]
MDEGDHMKLMLLVNPRSGRGLLDSALGAIVNMLCSNGFSVTVYFTGALSAATIAAEFGARYDVIVCVGGDGTLSGAVSGLMRAHAPTPVGYIPKGTAHDVANTLSLSHNPRLAAQTIIDGIPVPVDVGQFGTNEYFVYIAAFGAFTGVSYLTPQSAKRTLGHLAYVIGGIADLSAIRPRHTVIEHDGGLIEGEYIFGGVTNSLSVAGLARLSPSDVNLNDGLFEVLLVRRPISTHELIGIVSSIMNKSYRSDNVQMLHTSRVAFTFDEDVSWTRDGEDGGAHSRVEIVNRARAVRILLDSERISKFAGTSLGS